MYHTINLNMNKKDENSVNACVSADRKSYKLCETKKISDLITFHQECIKIAQSFRLNRYISIILQSQRNIACWSLRESNETVEVKVWLKPYVSETQRENIRIKGRGEHPLTVNILGLHASTTSYVLHNYGRNKMR